MRTSNQYIYEIISVAFGFSIIALFGTLSFFPMEIMVMGEHQSWYSAIVIFTISIIISFFLLNYIPSLQNQIMMISEFIIQLLLVICLVVYFNFNSTITENWFVQPGWFLRSEGVVIGIFLGVVVIKTASGLSFLVKSLTLNHNNIESDVENFQESLRTDHSDKNKQKINISLIVLSSLFYIILILLLRYTLFFGVFIFSNCLQFALTGFALIQIESIKNSRFYLKSALLKGIQSSETKNMDERVIIIKKGARKFFNDYKGLSIYLLILLIFSIIILPIFSLNIRVEIIIPFGLNTLIGKLSLNIILALSVIFLMFIGITSYIFRTKSHQRYGFFYPSHLKRSVNLLILAFIDAMKALGIFAVIGQIIYYYDYPIFFPRIISYYLAFGCLGAIFYYFIVKIKSHIKIQPLIYVISIIVLIVNFIFTYYDGITNSQPIFESPEWFLSFDFLYLHSIPNFIIVGISIGIILSEFLFNFLFKDTDASDSVNRALFLIFSIFFFLMLQLPGNYILNNPGNDPPLSDQTSIVFLLLTTIFSIILIIGLGCYLVYEIITPKILSNRKFKPSIQDNFYIKELNALRKRNPWKISYKTVKELNKKWKIISLLIMISFSLIGILVSYNVYNDGFKRPMVASSNSNYNIWVLNSSERVAKSTPFSTDQSSIINSINISTAKNEYNAIQLIWKPIGSSIHGLTYDISDFKKSYESKYINQQNFSLRYVEWVIEDEFPDILLNFTSINFELNINNILWFSFKTPKNIDAGWYSGNITFQFNTYETQIVHINLNVWNFTIPEMKHLRTTIGAYSLSNQQINNYIEHRVNDYGIQIRPAQTLTVLENEPGYTCYLNTSDHYWVFNWTWWDSETQKKLDLGMNNFIIEYPLGIVGEYRYPYVNNSTKILELQDWLTSVQNHMESKNWLNYSSMFFVDEFALFIPDGYTRAGYFAELLILAEKIKEAAPKLRIISTAPPSDELTAFQPYFDIYSPVTSDYEKSKWDSLMQEGKEFWMYASVGPLAPYPCSHLYNRLFEIRILFWQAWLYQIQGFLYWHAQAYFHGKNSIGYNGYGDGWFIYTQNNILYDSIRWENYLEAQEDYEYMWILNSSLNYLKTHSTPLSENEIDYIQQSFTTCVKTLVGEKTDYTNDPKNIYNARQILGNLLNFISLYVNISSISESSWNWL